MARFRPEFTRALYQATPTNDRTQLPGLAVDLRLPLSLGLDTMNWPVGIFASYPAIKFARHFGISPGVVGGALQPR